MACDWFGWSIVLFQWVALQSEESLWLRILWLLNPSAEVVIRLSRDVRWLFNAIDLVVPLSVLF